MFRQSWVLALSFLVATSTIAKQPSDKLGAKVINLEARSGQKFVDFLALVCTDEEWKPVSAWIKRTSFATTEIPGFSLTLGENSVATVEGDVSVDFNAADRVRAKIGAQQFEGSICGIVAQAVGGAKSASVFDLVIPHASAEERMDPNRISIYLGSIAVGMAGGMLVGGPIIALAAGGVVAYGGVKVLEEREKQRVNRNTLERRLIEMLGKDDFKIVSCSPTEIRLQAGAWTATVKNGRDKEVYVTAGSDTGRLLKNSGVSRAVAEHFSQCKTKPDSQKWSAEIAGLIRTANKRALEGAPTGIPANRAWGQDSGRSL